MDKNVMDKMELLKDKRKKINDEIKKLNVKKYRRFNVLLKSEAFERLEQLAKYNKKSKSKMLARIILNY